MNNQEISERLEVRFEAENIDLLQLGTISVLLHRVFNRVAEGLYADPATQNRERRSIELLDQIPRDHNREDVLVRLRVDRVAQGSIVFHLQPLIAVTLAHPWATAIAQNLAANALWAISTWGIGVLDTKVNHKSLRTTEPSQSPGLLVSDGRKIRPNVRKLVEVVGKAGNGGKLTFKTKEEELSIEFYPPKG